MTEAATIDAVLRTLADPTRRAVFERIATSDEITVGELTHGSGVTQGAISQHLKSLKQAGLVAERPEGRKVFYRADPSGLAPLREWLSFYERFWTGRLDVLERLLRNDQRLGWPWLRLRLVATRSQPDAFGARVEVHTPRHVFMQTVVPVMGFLAQSESTLTFGLGDDARVRKIVIHWPSGRVQEMIPEALNRTLVVSEP